MPSIHPMSTTHKTMKSCVLGTCTGRVNYKHISCADSRALSFRSERSALTLEITSYTDQHAGFPKARPASLVFKGNTVSTLSSTIKFISCIHAIVKFYCRSLKTASWTPLVNTSFCFSCPRPAERQVEVRPGWSCSQNTTATFL